MERGGGGIAAAAAASTSAYWSAEKVGADGSEVRNDSRWAGEEVEVHRPLERRLLLVKMNMALASPVRPQLEEVQARFTHASGGGSGGDRVCKGPSGRWVRR